MKLETRKLLFDAVDASRSIQTHCSGKTFEQYAADRFFRRAVEREFEIIGEAFNRLTRFDPETADRISELRRIVDFRNRIIHGYDAIDDEIVWKTIQQDVPPLIDRLSALLNPPDEDAK